MTSNDYSDIINLPRPTSSHPHMSMDDRAAQFAPYATLTGHRDIVAQDESIAARKVDLDQNIEIILDQDLEES